ncbi:hypothetical protein HPB48_004784 [Haemaphysalis longicornis]|uniref:DDE Tnp4 domain-containing protein n=1 Tax=Haemaphysalis longicornis TaxID=44386 RepID=A0A9J6FEP3_HAELO|nr:hypothetical protein HPB48_004784 [Haemaphysalis longicornis]
MPQSILCNRYALAELAWSDIEALVLRRREPQRRMYVARNGMLNIEGMPATTFRRQFRFEKADFEVLVRALEMPDIVTSAQGVRVAGTEALCMCLRRLAYPNRLCDLQEYFGRHYSVISSITNKVMLRLETQFGVLLDDLTAHPWLTPAHLKDMSDAVHSKGAPLSNCWAFIEGTARPICRPTQEQRLYFSGHKRVHALKYQSLMCPNGLICQLDGPYPGSRHDAGILRESELYEKLEAVVQGHRYVIYGDPAYPLRPLLMKPYGGALVTRAEESFNKAMSTVRQAVEWGFGRIIAEFAFLDLKKNQKIMLQAVPRMYRVATLLTNCHSCMYGNRVSGYFNLEPPSLSEYLSPAKH